MNSISAISARVIQLLNERNWSAYILAFERGLPNSTVSNILLCKSCNFDTILNFCRCFRILLEELCHFENLDDNDSLIHYISYLFHFFAVLSRTAFFLPAYV